MASTVEKLTELGLIRPQSWLPNNTMYETIMGSVAYGVSSDFSDMDVYGWCIVHGDKMLEEKLGRNDPCPCGSGKRFKRCCLKKGRF